MKRLPITARTTSEMEATDSKTTNPVLLGGRWTLDIVHFQMLMSFDRFKRILFSVNCQQKGQRTLRVCFEMNKE